MSSDWSFIPLRRLCSQLVSAWVSATSSSHQLLQSISLFSSMSVCARVCVVTLSSPSPLFPLQNSQPTLLSTPIPPFLTYSYTVFFSHTRTHSWINTHTLLPHEAQQQPDVSESLEKVTSVCVCVCVFNAAASLQQISASLGTEHNRTGREGRSRFTTAESGILHKVMIAWSHVKMLCNDICYSNTHCYRQMVKFGVVWVRLVGCRCLILMLWHTCFGI